MSARLVTVKELMVKLSSYPPDTLVVIPERHLEPGEARIEGNLDGPDYVELVNASEVRSGFLIPPDGYLEDTPVVVLSSCGVEHLIACQNDLF